jgi:hypothetical protein
MDHYCTYFDKTYLLRGLTLFRSLVSHSSRPFTLWVLCFDDYTFEIVSRLRQPNLKPIHIVDFERGDTALLSAKENRSRVEYYFTCTPSWPLYILNNQDEFQENIETITYLDSDLFFFSDSAPLLESLGQHAALIIPHRFPPSLQHLEIHGIYNVGMLIFRNNETGLQILTRWREQCIEWCYDYTDGKRFGDQKYLDDWPDVFPEVIVSSHSGANLAPWNWMNYRRIRKHSDKYWVEDEPLIFYHFQGLKIFAFDIYDPGMSEYEPMPYNLRRLLYGPYIKELHSTIKWANSLGQSVLFEHSKINSRTYGFRQLFKGILQRQITWAI